MDEDDLAFITLASLAEQIRTGSCPPLVLTDYYLKRIEALDGNLNAFISVTADEAQRAAEKRGKELHEGRYRGPLHGIPVALKDLIEIEGMRTTAGSKILEDFVSRRTATVAQRLLKAGIVPIGKTNLQEFARGPTGADSHFGPTANPWDLTRIAGGSSSGSAAAVAAGLVPAALGSDTGGSVRIPAALCGIVGIRPTYGRVSRYGVVPLGLTFDTVGPLTRSVEDAAIMLTVIAGHDPLDPSTEIYPVPDFRAAVDSGRTQGIKGIRIGVPTSYFFPGYDTDVEQCVRHALRTFTDLGAELHDVEVPFAEAAGAAYTSVVGPECANYHREFLRTRRDDYLGPTGDFFELALFIPGWRYTRGQQARALFMKQSADIFRTVDLIATPTVPVVAPPIAAADGWGALLHCTLPFSTVGTPALSVPCGFTKHGYPVGLQLVAGWWQEELLFRVGAAYEAQTSWYAHRPPLRAVAHPIESAKLGREPVATNSATEVLTTDCLRALSASMGIHVSEARLASLQLRLAQVFASFDRLDSLALEDFEPNCHFRVPPPQRSS